MSQAPTPWDKGTCGVEKNEGGIERVESITTPSLFTRARHDFACPDQLRAWNRIDWVAFPVSRLFREKGARSQYRSLVTS